MNGFFSGHHGHLKSSNCVVDFRWICKLTDYGLEALMAKSEVPYDDKMTEHRAKGLLWKAPEILRNTKNVDQKAADVYSFGIVLQEIMMQDVAFAVERESHSLEEIIDNVLHGTPAFRPKIPEGEVLYNH